MAKFLTLDGLTYFWGELKKLLAGKVDTEDGKGLSTNDFTTAEKEKLSGIAAGANNYTHPTSDGNKHVPATGTTNNGNFLKAGSSAGSISWAALTGDDIPSLDASKLTGTIDIARLPAGALERCVVVADDTARYALTSSNVQVGDTVKVESTGIMYFVKDDTKLSSDDGYIVYTAGSATSVPWSGVTGKPSSMKNPNALDIQFNGTTNQSYDGSSAKTVNITPEALGISEITTAEIDTMMG